MNAMDMFLATPIPMPSYMGRVFPTDYDEIGIPVLLSNGSTSMLCMNMENGSCFLGHPANNWDKWLRAETAHRTWEDLIVDDPEVAADLWTALYVESAKFRPGVIDCYREPA